MLFLLLEGSDCFPEELQGMAHVYWNDLTEHRWVPEGVGPKKLPSKGKSGKFIDIDIYSPLTVDLTFW